MKKAKLLLTNAETKLMMKMAGVKAKREEGDHLLEVLGTIIIAVVILILFKDVIVNIFTNALGETESQVTNLFTGVTVPDGGGATPTP